jgi:SAM-dependent methyltransferase
MKGQPHLSAGYPEPYAAIADTYDRLVDWAINEWGESPRPHMGAFLQNLWSDRSVPVKTVLEICCGTGRMLEELVKRGYSVAGLDRSAAMLEQARRRLGPQVALVHAELPEIPVDQQFDAVICAAAGLNYVSDEGDLAKIFHQVASTVRTEGSFVFDILSRHMIENNIGKSIWAADLGDLAFIWNFDKPSSGGYCDLTYTQFLRRDGAPTEYVGTRELHRFYVLDREVIRHLARDAGFVDVAVCDNYSSRPVTDATLYETWMASRA